MWEKSGSISPVSASKRRRHPGQIGLGTPKGFEGSGAIGDPGADLDDGVPDIVKTVVDARVSVRDLRREAVVEDFDPLGFLLQDVDDPVAGLGYLRHGLR